MPTSQYTVSVRAPRRGYHLITDKIISALKSQKPISSSNSNQVIRLDKMKAGMCHIFIQHTSAGLSINENCDPDVRHDLEESLNRIVPENQPFYRHTAEGPDDMPSHVKSSLLGCSVQIPVTNGSFNLGTWQGVYLCEFRDRPSNRNLVITLTE